MRQLEIRTGHIYLNSSPISVVLFTSSPSSSSALSQVALHPLPSLSLFLTLYPHCSSFTPSYPSSHSNVALHSPSLTPPPPLSLTPFPSFSLLYPPSHQYTHLILLHPSPFSPHPAPHSLFLHSHFSSNPFAHLSSTPRRSSSAY